MILSLKQTCGRLSSAAENLQYIECILKTHSFVIDYNLQIIHGTDIRLFLYRF